MTPPRRWLTGLAVVLSVVVFGWWRVSHDAEAPRDAVGTTRSEAPATVPQSNAALPPPDVPLAQAHPTLETLARAGNAPAACRLAAEVEICGDLPVRRQDHDRWLAERGRALELVTMDGPAGAATDFERVFEAQLEHRTQLLDRFSRHCTGAPIATARESIANWRRAALLGHPTAVKQYASGRVFGWDGILETAPLLPRYRAEAESMLEQVARQGDLEATILLARAHSPLPAQARSLLAQVVEPDGARALALYRHAYAAVAQVDSHDARTVGSDLSRYIDELEHALPPDARARAALVEADLRADWGDPEVPAEFNDRIGHGSAQRASPADCR